MSSTGIVVGGFDIHQHVGQLVGFHDADAADSLDQECRARTDFLDRFGILQAALMPSHAYPQPNGAEDTRRINDRLIALAAHAPERFPALFGTVEPRHGDAAVDEARRLAMLGFRGISWHPRFQGLPMDHPVMCAVLEEMRAAGMAALIHCYAQGDFEAPWRLRRLAEQFPTVPFVALDVMTSPENLEQLAAVAERLDNVWLDITSTSLGAEGIRYAVDRLGAGRILFGTNHYGGPVPPALVEADALADAELACGDLARIVGDNARALLAG